MILERKLRRANRITTNTGGIVLYSRSTATANTQTSYSIRIPTGVTSIAGLAIGAGGGGGGTTSATVFTAPAGGGGGLAYTNNISVTPGETLTVVVPNQSQYGLGGGQAPFAGYAANVLRSATILLSAPGGKPGVNLSSSATGNTFLGGAGGNAANAIGTVKFSGGAGGMGINCSPLYHGAGGGGGAAGYSGNGGAGGSDGQAGSPGTGGGGGGGASYTANILGGMGGGTLWYGPGAIGQGGVYSSLQTELDGNMGSSLGGSESIFPSPDSVAVGGSFGKSGGQIGLSGFPGGGGPGGKQRGSATFPGASGMGGAVRILWGDNLDYGNASSGVAYNSIFYKGYTTSSTNTITLPSVDLGDTLVIIDYAKNTSGAPTLVSPAGYTLGLNTTTDTRRLANYSRQILSANESGTTITLTNGTESNAKFAIVISGKYGASYSEFLGTDSVGDATNGQLGGLGVYNTIYTETGIDCYAEGIPVGFFFFNSTVPIDSDAHMIYAGSRTLVGPTRNTYVKISAYPQTTTSLSIPLYAYTPGQNLNSFNFWITKFY